MEDNDVLNQIEALQNKINIFEYQNSKISLKDLDEANFDIEIYFKKNGFFNNGQLDFFRIPQQLNLIYELQRKTCEQIAMSVDLNLDKYVQISEQFEALTRTLTESDDTQKLIIKETLHFQNECQKQESELVVLLYNQKSKLIKNSYLIDQMQDNLKNLQKTVKTVKQVQLFCSDQKYIYEQHNAFEILNYCKKLQHSDQEIQNIQKGVRSKDLCQQFKLDETIKMLKQKMLKILEQQFTKFLEKLKTDYKDEDQLYCYLRSFSHLSQHQQGQKLVNDVLLIPKCQKLLQIVTQNKQLQDFYENIIQFIKTTLKPFIEMNQQLLEFDFITSFWEICIQFLSLKELNFIFGVGIIETFKQNFSYTIIFIQQFQEFFQPKDKQKFIQSQTFQKFYKKWNLNTYFQLKSSEIAKNFEMQLSNALVLNFPEIESIFFASIQDCFIQKNFLKQLSSNYVKLSFQIIKRFLLVLNQQQNEFEISKKLHISLQLSNIKTSIKEQYFQNIYNTIKIHDFKTYEQLHNQNFHEKTQILIEKIQTEIQDLINILLKDQIHQISKQCIENLQPYNGLAVKIRSMNEKPTKASNFAANIFRPIQNFLNNNNTSQIIRKLMIEMMVKQVLETFKQNVDQILNNAMQMNKYSNEESKEYEYLQTQFKIVILFSYFKDSLELESICKEKFEVDYVIKLNFYENE